MKNVRVSARVIGISCVTLMLSACAIMPASGPSTRSVLKAPNSGESDIKVIDVTGAVTRQVVGSERKIQFLQILGKGLPIDSTIGKGDVLDVSIWEAPPAALFGVAASDSQLTPPAASISHGTSLPEQMVDSDGQIVVPFVGHVQAAGRTPQEISREIVARLARKAHQPQAVVRLVRNVAAAATVVGDVEHSERVPLTAGGERVLDALAITGGTKHPVDKITIQITRGSQFAAMPLGEIIHDPDQDIMLQPNDVVTVLFQPFSFTAFGATGRNEEIPIEATGVTLAQGLGRVAGLQDSRADVKGVFLFRFETPEALTPEQRATAKIGANGLLPVIYRFNMKDPATLFLAQNFPIHNKDVLYVSNAPLADFQKFVSVIYSAVLPAATTAVAAP
jgi:polysaccharide export outer membrane protein